MIFSIERLLWTLSLALLLASAACGSDPNMMLSNQAGSGAGSPAAGGGAGASPAAAGSAGKPDEPLKVAGAGGAGAVAAAGKAGGAGSSAGSGGAGAGAGGSSPAGSGAAAGSGGMAGAAGATAGAAAGAGGAAGSGMPGLKPRCKSDPDQVIVVGDSYINWITHSFPDDLAREAGETWRMYAVGGCSLGSGGLCLIPEQLDQAIAADPDIIAAVMSGGGNDILIADEVMFPGGSACKDREDSPTQKACQDIVATAIEAGKKLMDRAAEAKIRDVIYLFYPHIPGGGFGGAKPNFMLDYALPKARELCQGAEQRTQGKLRCHFLDLVPVFEGHADWFADDGIHENSLGSAAMAKEVVKLAKEKCVAQPASSGCCEP